jgi:phospholipase C
MTGSRSPERERVGRLGERMADNRGGCKDEPLARQGGSPRRTALLPATNTASVFRSLLTVTACVAVGLSTACSSIAPSAAPAVSGAAPFGAPVQQVFGNGAIKHIVVIVQENRSVDNLFNGFPGADTAKYGINEQGQKVKLQSTSLTAPYDLSHTHKAWVVDYDGGKLEGFDREAVTCYTNDTSLRPPRTVAAYGYVPRTDVEPYWEMAQDYTFADKMFQSNQGPSFPAHQYIISGTSAIANGSQYLADDNVDSKSGFHQGGCSSHRDSTVPTIDVNGQSGPPVFPCFDRISIIQLMDDRKVTWRYFQQIGGSGAWHAVDAIKSVWKTPNYANVRWPSKRALEMIDHNEIPSVTFITPSAQNSDHAARNDGGGPAWVASIVNSIGLRSDWQSTAILVVWDDWGGWYDHVPPKVYNSNELGFRVPMIVISPYAKQGYVSHVHYEFGSILKLIEETFGLKSLGTTDVRANDLSDCFDFAKPAMKFVPIHAGRSARYFENEPVDDRPIDDDE